MDANEIFNILKLADLAAAYAAKVYASVASATGKSVEELRAERDNLSAETHAILDEELKKMEGK